MDDEEDWQLIMENYRNGRLGSFSSICEPWGVNVNGSSTPNSGFVSFTDCSGVARARFTTSSFGGDNHILVAQACPGWQTGQNRCVEPAASETIEIWRKAEVYQVVLNNNQNPLYLCDDPSYPLAFTGPFQNRFDIVDTTFMDCFVEVEYNDYDLKESIDFVLQVGRSVDHRDERSSGNPLYQMDVCSDGPSNPLYRYLLLCCDYHCGREVFICDECMPNGDEWYDTVKLYIPTICV